MSSLREQIEPFVREIGLREVARRSGVPNTRISEWLSGRRDMYGHRIDAIAAACGLTISVRAVGRGRRRTAVEPPNSKIVR
ncbi:MAG: hypothetical protein AMXMBFR77_26950 [Phycisphaerales bacterium]